MERVRVLLADDQQEMLDTISRLMDGKFEIIGAVADGQCVLEAASRMAPDLVVLDISMPIMNGLQAAARLQESGSQAKVVILTVHNDPDYLQAAFSAGARAYVLKSRLGTDLLPAIQEVLHGRTFVSPSEKNLESGREFPSNVFSSGLKAR